MEEILKSTLLEYDKSSFWGGFYKTQIRVKLSESQTNN